MEHLNIVAFGGLGEVGMNSILLECQHTSVLIDCGVRFTGQSYPGIDYFIPDFSYLFKKTNNLKALVITHAHDDHIGAVPFLASSMDLNIYCTDFAKKLIETKLSEINGIKKVNFHRIIPFKEFKIGPFLFEPIAVDHSIVESLGFGIGTPVGNIVHSGDFKEDSDNRKKTNIMSFRKWGQKGVELLLSDSTNAEEPSHTLSEKKIIKTFNTLFSSQNSRIFISLFASNVKRIENLLWLAKKHGKVVALVGRSIHTCVNIAQQEGLINIPENMLILPEDIHRYNDDKLVIILTGSQAERRSALQKLTEGSHKYLKVKKGDLFVLSSRLIPGNEKAVNSMINELFRKGAEVIYASNCANMDIHASGHAYREELIKLIRVVNPKYFIPIHGEYKHLIAHKKLALKCGIKKENIFVIENGQAVILDKNGLRIHSLIELQKRAVISNYVMNSNSLLFQERQELSRTGVVSIVVVKKIKTHELVCRPKVTSIGVLVKEGYSIDEVCFQVSEYIEEIYPQLRGCKDEERMLSLEVRKFFKKVSLSKPLVIPVIVNI